MQNYKVFGVYDKSGELLLVLNGTDRSVSHDVNGASRNKDLNRYFFENGECGCLIAKSLAEGFTRYEVKVVEKDFIAKLKPKFGSKTVLNKDQRRLLYGAYKSMKSRCYNKNTKSYHNYGGRGIQICDRWLEHNGNGFINFVDDMGSRPKDRSLDRINNDGDYSPDNCRWATTVEQSLNKRTTGKVLYNGELVDSHSLCAEHAIKPATFRYRLAKGLSVEEALVLKQSSSRRFKMYLDIGIKDSVLTQQYTNKRGNTLNQWKSYLKRHKEGFVTSESWIYYSNFVIDNGLVEKDWLVFFD